MQYTTFVATTLLLKRVGCRAKPREQASGIPDFGYKVAGSFTARRRLIIVMDYRISEGELGISGIGRMRKGGVAYSTLPGGGVGRNLEQIVQYGGSRQCIIRLSKYDVARIMTIGASSARLAHLPENACIEFWDQTNETKESIPLPSEDACKALYEAVVNEQPGFVTAAEMVSLDDDLLSLMGVSLLARGKRSPRSAEYPFAIYPAP